MYNGNGRRSYEVRSRIPRVQPVRQKPSGLAIVLAVLIGAALLVGAGYLGAFLATAGDSKSDMTAVLYDDPTVTGEILTDISYTGEELGAVKAAELAKRSVVEIDAAEAGRGSGVVIAVSEVNADGTGEDAAYIITNCHVVKGAGEIKVTLPGGTKCDALWAKGDEAGDIAVIKIAVDCSAIGLKAAVSGTGVQPQAGQQVIAVGNPLGDLGGSVAVGYIAASNRTVMVGDRKMDLIQLDMSLNAGNSGGGLFDLRGALIGIVNAKSLAPDAEGIGFAIPLSDAVTAAVGIMERGYAPGRVDTDMLRFKEVSSGGAMASGLYVSDNSGAEVIPEGAYIVEVDGETISTRAQWVALLNEKAVNETIRITYEKDGTVSTETVTLPEKKSCDWEYRRG